MLFTLSLSRFTLQLFGNPFAVFLQDVRRPPLNDVLRRLSGSLKKLRETLEEAEDEETRTENDVPPVPR